MQEAISTARSRRPFTIIGMVLALLTLGAFLFLATQNRGTLNVGTGNAGDVSVVVAKVDIAARSTVTSDMLQVVKFNSKDAPPLSFASVSQVGKSKYALVSIATGQPVLANELVAAGSDLSATGAAFLDIPSNFVAITIPTSEQQGVAGYIQPGDYIGIIATVQKGDQTVTRTVFNNVHVIRVGTTSTSITAGRNGPTATQTVGGSGSSLTVVMDECNAEYLTWFLARTDLRYTLENFKDYNPATGNPFDPSQPSGCTIDKATGVTNASVAARYGAALVP
jgi:pilus assembly protein CpaB